jgi:hypothetical protein
MGVDGMSGDTQTIVAADENKVTQDSDGRDRVVALGADLDAVESLAEFVRKHFNLGERTPVDVESLAKEIGADVEYPVSFTDADYVRNGERGEQQLRTISIDATDKVRILLSPMDGYTARRFTLAHELGHYFLHSVDWTTFELDNPNFGARRVYGVKPWTPNYLSEADDEANWFAAALLMPRTMVSRALTECQNNLDMASRLLAATCHVESVIARSRIDQLLSIHS